MSPELQSALRLGDAAAVEGCLSAQQSKEAAAALAQVALNSNQGLQCEDIVRLLLQHGAGPNGPGCVALQVAIEQGYTGAAMALLEAKADIHARGNWALDAAVKHEQQELLEILLDRGARPLANYGRALVSAAALPSLDSLTKLLDRCPAAPLCEQDQEGLRHALRSAALNGAAGGVQLLLDRGADPGDRAWLFGVYLVHNCRHAQLPSLLPTLKRLCAMLPEAAVNLARNGGNETAATFVAAHIARSRAQSTRGLRI